MLTDGSSVDPVRTHLFASGVREVIGHDSDGRGNYSVYEVLGLQKSSLLPEGICQECRRECSRFGG